MSGNPVRVLVTGFGPFPGVPRNASAELVLRLASGPAEPELDIAAAVIPVVWASARAAAREAVTHFKPDAILHFGVAKRASGFEVETRAFNISGHKEDCRGEVRTQMPLAEEGKPVLVPVLPPMHLVRALRKGGYPAALSADAGRYLCNALFYWSLCDREGDGRPASFIHLPAFGVAEVEPRLTMEEAVEGGRILVRASAEAVLRARRSRMSKRGASDGPQAFHRNGRSGGSLAGGDPG